MHKIGFRVDTTGSMAPSKPSAHLRQQKQTNGEENPVQPTIFCFFYWTELSAAKEKEKKAMKKRVISKFKVDLNFRLQRWRRTLFMLLYQESSQICIINIVLVVRCILSK